MDYLNFYTIFGLGFVFLFFAAMYYIVWVMQYQNAATPFPAVGASAPCPDGWELDAAGWCKVPPSRVTAATVSRSVSPNVGTIHTDDPTYAKFVGSVPGAHKAAVPATVPPTYTTANITPDDFSKGLVSIDFTKADICAKKKWAVLYGVMWDGVSNYNAC